MIGFSILDKLLAIARRDLLSALRYRTAFWLQTVAMLAQLAAFFYLARAVGPGFRPDGVDYYPFLLVGTALYSFTLAGVSACVSAIHDAQITGTMEVLMTTSTPAPVIVFLSAFSTFAGRTLHLVFYLVAGFLLFQTAPPKSNFLGSALIFLLSLALALAVGVMAAAIQVVVQKGSGVVFLLGSFGWFLSGTLFPVSALPEPLSNVAALFPLTYSLQGMRMALLQGASFRELAGHMAALGLFCLLLLPASLYLFSRAVRHARQQGTLSFY